MKRHRGQAAIEFALVSVPLLFLIMGGLDVLYGLSRHGAATVAVSQGAILASQGANEGTIRTSVSGISQEVLAPGDISITPPSCYDRGAGVTVTVTATEQWRPLTPLGDALWQARSAQPIQLQASSVIVTSCVPS